MSVRYGSCLRQPRKGGAWYVCITQRGDGRDRRIIHSGHETRLEAEVARRAILDDLASHWREPAKRGPKPLDVRWWTRIQSAVSGWKVSLIRIPREGRKQETVLATVTSRHEAEALRDRIRLDPGAHWREPREDHHRAREAKQRAAARRVMREPAPAPAVEPAPEPVDGAWLLGCGVHEAARPVHPCPVCARAAELTAASVEVVVRHRYAWAVMKAREEAA